MTGTPASSPRPAAAGHASADVSALAAEVRRLRVELAEARGQLDKPCGHCHPCHYWAEQTWRAAGRTPPSVLAFDALMAEVELLRDIAFGLADVLRQLRGRVIPADALGQLRCQVAAWLAEEYGQGLAGRREPISATP